LPAWLGPFQALLVECAPGQSLMSRDKLVSIAVDSAASGTLPALHRLERSNLLQWFQKINLHESFSLDLDGARLLETELALH
jgi:hypothetical protein